MSYYRLNKLAILCIDLCSMIISFAIAFTIRFRELIRNLGNVRLITTYIWFFVAAGIIYIGIFFVRTTSRLERQSRREILYEAFIQQAIFICVYVLLFFIFHQAAIIIRIVVGILFLGNVILSGSGRLIYKNYCINSVADHTSSNTDDKAYAADENDSEDSSSKAATNVTHCYIIGSKSIGQYGGFETFVMNLLQQHKDNKNIKYHVACKANGQGYMDVDSLPGAKRVNENEFTYCNAHGFLIPIPEKLGSAQAIYYDIKALKWVCDHIERNHINHPIVYILASRIGPFERRYVRRIHDAGGLVYQNPDGREALRLKWNFMIQRYWQYSERIAIKYADLVVCDSVNIESYIKEEYASYHPKTTYIAYGSDVTLSSMKDDDPKYINWLTEHNLRDGEYYISVGRFVPENNFKIMIREFMKSKSKKDFAIITTENPKYAEGLQQKLGFRKDKRIKFVGTVYDAELLKKIRERAYGYFHGHEVGGTNPSLLESLGSTNLNLLLDVGFNREVAEDAALYWSKDEGSLENVINIADKMDESDVEIIGNKAKQRIINAYSWKYICDKYEHILLKVKCDKAVK